MSSCKRCGRKVRGKKSYCSQCLQEEKREFSGRYTHDDAFPNFRW